MGIGVPQHSRMDDEYREAVEQRMQGGSSGHQSLKGFLRKQATKGGGNTASVGEFQQRLYEQAKPENDFWEGFRRGIGAPQQSRMDDEYREAVEQRMQGGTGQSFKGFLKKQGAKGGGNTASVGEFQQRLYEQAKTENDKDFWEGFRRGIGTPQHSRMTNEYREAIEQRMQGGGAGQSLKDALGQIRGNAKTVGDDEEKSFWEGFRKGLGLKDGEEVGGGRPGEMSFSAMGVAAHRPGIYQDDNEYTREKLEEEKRERQEEILELLWKHGYDEDELTGDLLNDLLYNGTGLGEDHAKFVQLVKEINRIDERIIYLYTSEEMGEYDLNDTEYLQGLIATGETCINLGGADALDSFLENNHISRMEYYNARRALQDDMGDAFDGFIAELPGAGEVEDTDNPLLPDLAETNEEESVDLPVVTEPAGSSFQYIYSDTVQDNDQEYEVQNETGQEINQDTINNIVSTALSEMEGLGEEYQIYIDEDNVNIHLMDYDESTYTQEEAQQLFLTEQEQRNETIKGVVSLFRCYKDPMGLIAFIANETMQGNVTSEFALKKLMSENPDIFTDAEINGLLIDYAINYGIELICNAADELHYDMEDIDGGDYIIVTIKLEMMTDDGRKSYLVDVRLIKENGEYVYDPENPLCYVLPDSY